MKKKYLKFIYGSQNCAALKTWHTAPNFCEGFEFTNALIARRLLLLAVMIWFTIPVLGCVPFILEFALEVLTWQWHAAASCFWRIASSFSTGWYPFLPFSFFSKYFGFIVGPIRFFCCVVTMMTWYAIIFRKLVKKEEIA